MKMRVLVPILILGSLVLPVRADAAYERTDAMVAMSDGVQLDVSVYLPAGTPAGARLPLIVRHHGGGSNKSSPYDVQYGLKLVDAGFALLMYSHRGHGNSQGTFDFFGARTTQDFSEMLDWVAATFGDRIDTSNVGSSGYSQGGGESLLPAEQDARVKALAVGNTFADLNQALNPNDCYKFSFATGIFVGAYTVSQSRVDDVTAARWGAQLNTDTEDVSPDQGFQSTTNDLRARSPLTYVRALIDRRVPVFWAQSWEDQLFPGDHPERILKPLEDAGVPVHYWFSSGGHAAGADDPADQAGKEQGMLDWFDQFLRGHDHGFTTGPKVDYAQRETGGFRKTGEWTHHTATEWPIPGTTSAVLSPRADGTLGASSSASVTVGTIVNDYASVSVANDAIANEVGANIPGLDDVFAQIPESKNPLDTATFTSAPLTSPVNVVGAPRVVLDVSATPGASAPGSLQADVKVWDLAPDGSARLIMRGCDSIPSGQAPAGFDFQLWPNAHRFAAGDRIALTISSVDFPTFKPDVEPNVMSLLSGSKIELPVVS